MHCELFIISEAIQVYDAIVYKQTTSLLRNMCAIRVIVFVYLSLYNDCKPSELA